MLSYSPGSNLINPFSNIFDHINFKETEKSKELLHYILTSLRRVIILISLKLNETKKRA